MPNLTNNFTQPVILDDDRDPYVSWQHHRERGSQGGVDLAYPGGTPVLAIADGACEPVADYGTGGNTMRLRLSDGSYVEYMHLSSFARGNGESVAVGDVIGYSGNTGGDYADHLHVHIYVNGVRCNVWDYFGSDSSSAAASSASAVMSDVIWSGDGWSYAEPIGDLAARIQASMSALGVYNFDDGSARPADGLFAEFSRKGVQRVLADTGTFVGDIDGEIWGGGCYGIQDLAAARGGYVERGGVRDGAPRLLSWTCFADALDALIGDRTPATPEPAAEPAAVVVEVAPAVVEPAPVEPAATVAPDTVPVAVSETVEPAKITHIMTVDEVPLHSHSTRPINEGDIMTLQEAIPTVTVADGALGEIIDEPKARRRIYTVWVLIGLTLQALTGGVIAGAAAAVAAVAAGWSFWLIVGVAVFAGIAGAYVALTPQVATLARANVKK